MGGIGNVKWEGLIIGKYLPRFPLKPPKIPLEMERGFPITNQKAKFCRNRAFFFIDTSLEILFL
jgi:hypothetical protein